MQLMKWNPHRELLNMNTFFDHFFDDTFSPEKSVLTNGHELWSPKVDIYDSTESYVIKAELPGLEKKDIKVDVNGNILTLKGEKNTEKEEKESKCYRREIFFGKFERSFTLPEAVDPAKIKAEYKSGVLTLVVPKPDEQKPREIAIH